MEMHIYLTESLQRNKNAIWQMMILKRKNLATLYSPQMKWLGLGKFWFCSVKMFCLYLSCMFHPKIESFIMEITQIEKKIYWKKGPYFNKTIFIFCMILICDFDNFYKINSILWSIFIPKMHFSNVKRHNQFLTYGFSDRITTFLKDFILNRVIIILRKNHLLNNNVLPNTLNMTAGQVSHYGMKGYIRKMRWRDFTDSLAWQNEALCRIMWFSSQWEAGI